MALSVRGAVNRANVIGFNVTTSDTLLTAVVTPTTIANSGFSKIHKIRVEITGGNAELFPLGRRNRVASELPADSLTLIDTVGADAAAAQKVVTTTANDQFMVGDIVYLHDNTYSNYEWGKVATVTPATPSITLSENLTNSYTTLKASQIGVCSNLNAYMPVSPAYVNEDGLNFDSLYIRRTTASNVTIKGYVVMA